MVQLVLTDRCKKQTSIFKTTVGLINYEKNFVVDFTDIWLLISEKKDKTN